MKAYFVAMFLLVGILAAALGANWWITLTRHGIWWLAVPMTGLAAVIAVWCFGMAVVAARTRYRP